MNEFIHQKRILQKVIFLRINGEDFVEKEHNINVEKSQRIYFISL